MKYDLNLTFGEIFNNDRSALLKQLIDIQQHKAKRDAAEKWAETLRFIDISNRPGKEPHKSKFPNHYIERAILYAQAKGINKLWVDIECIYQRPDDGEEDKTLGVQIMDAVYGGSDLSLGLLTTGLIHQSEVTLLAELLSGSVSVDFEDTEDPSFKPEVKFLELQTLVLRILSDARSSRGWIFQEDHLASWKMTLLVPHANDLNTKHLPYHFGKIPGNLQVKVSAFRKAVTMFCLANRASESRWPNTEILAKAKQYNIWNHEVHKTAPHYRNKHSVRLWNETNRLSGRRLDGEVTYSNESVYPNHCRFKSSTLRINERGVEVQGFLFALLPKRWPYPEKNKPSPLKLRQSDRNDLSRLAQDPEATRIEKGRYFSEFAAVLIRTVATKLQIAYGEDCRLAKYLIRHLELDAAVAHDEEPKASRAYAVEMMGGLIQALLDEREVRLARLEDESHLTPPSAIFIAPLHNDGWASEYCTKQYTSGSPRGWVFTSWDNGVQNTRVHGMEQLASLEVLPNQHKPFAYLRRWNPDQADNAVLRSCGWVNGVCDVEGKRMRRYTFPIAGLTEPPRAHREGSLGKRKRDDGNEYSATLGDGDEE
ncbi:hypothetical protein E8E11_008298 [Didymella keratinophila]|nr:hypothetical protein E8E11_008298 [Didymella keratinophila]